MKNTRRHGNTIANNWPISYWRIKQRTIKNMENCFQNAMCIRIICDASKNAIQNILVQEVWSNTKESELNTLSRWFWSTDNTSKQNCMENLNDKLNKANLIDIEQYAWKKENTAYFELFMKYLLIVFEAAGEMSKKNLDRYSSDNIFISRCIEEK